MSVTRKQYDALVQRVNVLSRDVARLRQVVYSNRSILKWVVASNQLGYWDSMPLDAPYNGELPIDKMEPFDPDYFGSTASFIRPPEMLKPISQAELSADVFLNGSGESYWP